jgi:hypothetical protein
MFPSQKIIARVIQGGITLGTMPQDRSTSEKRLSLAETIDSKRGD